MSRKKQINGVCCICGKYGDLSFEHVPPKAAYNQATAIAYTWEDHKTHRRSKHKIQGGVGAHTLCTECNNNTGSWYAREYVKWARNLHDLVGYWRRLGVTAGTVKLCEVYPIRFLKQVVTCYFSVATGPGTNAIAKKYPELMSFVLDKESQGLPSNFRFFVNLYGASRETLLRRLPIAGRLATTSNELGVAKSRADIFTDIAHPPLQLLIRSDGEDLGDATEITQFKDFAYSQKMDILIPLRIIGSSSSIAGLH